MKIKKLICTVLAFLIIFSAGTIQVFAEDAEKTSEAPEVTYEAPVFNAEEQVYEISKPDHIMYMSGDWKDGAPRDGHYVLTADIDMAGYDDFLPIASKKSEGFLGTFDGQFHAIKNLKVDYPKKYVGLFGYIGNQKGTA